MKQTILLYVAMAVLSVSGCGTNTYGIAQKTPRELASVSDSDLCYAQKYWRSPQMMREIMRRELKCSVHATAAQISNAHPPIGGRTKASTPEGDEFVGIWEYREIYTDEAKNYLKIINVGPGKFRLIEGFKGGYVNDKNRIMWRDRKENYYADDVIYLTVSRGRLEGELVSGVFRATHGRPYKYKLIIELTSNNTLKYSIWSSIRGETEVFEATRVGVPVELTKQQAKSGMQVIPRTFHGAWDAMEGKISRCKYGRDSDSRLTVTSSTVTYYEARCQLRRVLTSQPNAFRGLFICEGEGKRWAQEISHSRRQKTYS